MNKKTKTSHAATDSKKDAIEKISSLLMELIYMYDVSAAFMFTDADGSTWVRQGGRHDDVINNIVNALRQFVRHTTLDDSQKNCIRESIEAILTKETEKE